jgi:hypothetical protein
LCLSPIERRRPEKPDIFNRHKLFPGGKKVKNPIYHSPAIPGQPYALAPAVMVIG